MESTTKTTTLGRTLTTSMRNDIAASGLAESEIEQLFSAPVLEDHSQTAEKIIEEAIRLRRDGRLATAQRLMKAVHHA